MNRKKGIISVILLVVVLALVVLFFWRLQPYENVRSSAATSTSEILAYDQTQSDGTVRFMYPSKDFGLATNANQILVSSFIPPCSSNFLYCLNYKSTDYDGTNFESAGLRIAKRVDIVGEPLCLNTPPEGFDSSMVPNLTTSTDEYSTSVFSNVNDAATGHYASGILYRLYVRASSTCYEFETRIGQSQLANYPAGTVKEFTTADQASLQAELRLVLNTTTLSSGTKVVFP
ncbi:TPA: hypothetical protein DCQ44_03285 [Candidatus Taylorbacteria bacterium]|nr:hypothetical protein [Candidatus Taylorbacteria bacterium]